MERAFPSVLQKKIPFSQSAMLSKYFLEQKTAYSSPITQKEAADIIQFGFFRHFNYRNMKSMTETKIKKFIFSITRPACALLVVFSLHCNSAVQVDSGEGSPKSAEIKDRNLSLDGRWRLVSLNGQKPREVDWVFGKTVITLHMKKGKFNGYEGCNSYFGGKYNLDPNAGKIQFQGGARTTRGCPGMEIYKQSDLYMKSLNAVRTYQINNDNLLILKGENVSLNFRRLPKIRNLGLTEKTWTITYSAGPNPAGLMNRNSAYRMKFDANTLKGQTACGHFEAKYKTSGKTIRIHTLIHSAKPCVGDKYRYEQEKEFFLTLKKSNKFRIDGATLLIGGDEDRLLLFNPVN